MAGANNNIIVLNGVHYKLSPADYDLAVAHIGLLQSVLTRGDVVQNDWDSRGKSNAEQGRPQHGNGNTTLRLISDSVAATAAPVGLTDAMVQKLAGSNVLYYNFETNAWNTNTYNGHKIVNQFTDTYRVQEFKAVMDRIPEFSAQYEFVASVTKTMDKAGFNGWAKSVAEPKYSRVDTTTVGNIIVKNKKTGQYELYCKSWLGVRKYIAVGDGAFWFASYGVLYPEFRAALIAAHGR